MLFLERNQCNFMCLGINSLDCWVFFQKVFSNGKKIFVIGTVAVVVGRILVQGIQLYIITSCLQA